MQQYAGRADQTAQGGGPDYNAELRNARRVRATAASRTGIVGPETPKNS